jgi:hypothetical protein
LPTGWTGYTSSNYDNVGGKNNLLYANLTAAPTYGGLTVGATYRVVGSVYQTYAPPPPGGGAYDSPVLTIRGTGGESPSTIEIGYQTWTAFDVYVIAGASGIEFVCESDPDCTFFLDNGLQINSAQAQANTYYRRSTETKATPFIDVLCTVGAALDQNHQRSGGIVHNAFNATLELGVTTARSTSGQNSSHHSILSACRVALLADDTGYNSTNFPNIAILDIRPSGSSYDIDEDTNTDTTTLSFDLVFAVRPTAWPS